MLDALIDNYTNFANIPRRQRRQRVAGGQRNAPVVPLVQGQLADQRRAEMRNMRNANRVGVQRSPAEVTLMKLLKKRMEIGNVGDFRRVFERDVGRNPTDGTLAFFYALFRASNFDVKKIGIDTNLCSKPVVIPFVVNVQERGITTDSLYWYKRIHEEIGQRDYYDSFANIKNISISSYELIVFPNERDIGSCYTEDFDPDVCAVAITVDPNNPLVGNDIVNANQNFRFGGRDYVSYNINKPNTPYDGRFVYAINTMNVNAIADVINGQRVLYNKKSLINGFRRIRENAGAYYINTKISPTTFCPTTVAGFDDTNFYNVIRCELDPNRFLNVCIQANNFILIPNFITWDNMESSLELLIIGILATDIFNNFPAQQQLLENLRSYFEFKKFFLMMKKVYKKWERIVLMFIDSFKARVSIDRMRLVAEKCDEYLILHREIYNNEIIHNTLRDFVNSFQQICELMKNFIIGDGVSPFELIVSIKEACLMINDTTADIDSFQEKLRGAGFGCFDVLINGNNPMIPTIRSPSCFLGNLKGDFTANDLRLFAIGLRRQALDRIRNIGNVNWNLPPFNAALNGPLGGNLVFNQNFVNAIMGVHNQNDLNRLMLMFPPERRNELGIVYFVNLNNRVIAADPGGARNQALFLRRLVFPQIDQIVQAGFAFPDGDIDRIHNIYLQMRNLQNQMLQQNPNQNQNQQNQNQNQQNQNQNQQNQNQNNQNQNEARAFGEGLGNEIDNFSQRIININNNAINAQQKRVEITQLMNEMVGSFDLQLIALGNIINNNAFAYLNNELNNLRQEIINSRNEINGVLQDPNDNRADPQFVLDSLHQIIRITQNINNFIGVMIQAIQ